MTITRLARAARPSRARAEDGIALPTVIISMAVLTLFALASLAFVVNATPSSRRTGDAKAAVAAAQAGVDEYSSRLNARPTYYALNGTGIDPDNLAFTRRADGTAFPDGRDARGVPVPGTGSAGARFAYQVLTTPLETARAGLIRLRVTGTAANGQSRTLTASFGQDGYLRFLYFSDVESLDPSLGAGNRATTRDGNIGYYVDPGRTVVDSFKPDPAIFADSCSRHWYDEGGVPGRARGFSYRSSSTKPYIITREDANPPNDRVMTDAHDIAFSCTEIQFAGRDVITGPLHTNDAILLGGAATFQNAQTETSWGDDSAPAPANPARRWRASGYTGTPIGTQPYYAPVQSIPRSNSRLRAQAGVAGEGCLYSGETSIRLDGATMYVKSPGSTSPTTSPACLGGAANGASERSVSPIPAVVYVQNRTGSCSLSLDWPKAGESRPTSTTSTTNPAGGTTTSYDCDAGNAFVSGTLRGQTTLATENDIVITGDITYGGALNGEDVLGLIPNNYVWVYHPVKADGTELLAASARVRRIDAAILSLNRSFLVQNWSKGATDSPTLQVNGVIAQKFRGPVGTGTGTGYSKDYRYDTRLRYLPPPYFLTPVDSPWTVQTVTDG